MGELTTYNRIIQLNFPIISPELIEPLLHKLTISIFTGVLMRLTHGPGGREDVHGEEETRQRHPNHHLPAPRCGQAAPCLKDGGGTKEV